MRLPKITRQMNLGTRGKLSRPGCIASFYGKFCDELPTLRAHYIISEETPSHCYGSHSGWSGPTCLRGLGAAVSQMLRVSYSLIRGCIRDARCRAGMADWARHTQWLEKYSTTLRLLSHPALRVRRNGRRVVDCGGEKWYEPRLHTRNISIIAVGCRKYARRPTYYLCVAPISRTARGLYSFHELECKLRVQKLFDVFNLEFSVSIRSDLDD